MATVGRRGRAGLGLGIGDWGLGIKGWGPRAGGRIPWCLRKTGDSRCRHGGCALAAGVVVSEVDSERAYLPATACSMARRGG